MIWWILGGLAVWLVIFLAVIGFTDRATKGRDHE